ncbi:MAG TPA: tetratricopeptide repeat protein [Thermoleophilia bacterium]|nr:tetratricopeptide repeat protein [Thermoleophilia bacterium]
MDEGETPPQSSGTDDSRGRPAADHSEAYDLYRRGHAFLSGNHPGQAALLLERARRLAPGKNSIREALGRAYFHLGSYDRAAHEFAAILEHVPTNDYARYALGRSLLKLGQATEARAQLRLALAMSPGNRWYQAALEQCLAQEKRGADAEG